MAMRLLFNSIALLLAVVSFAAMNAKASTNRPIRIAALWSKNTASEYLCVLEAMTKQSIKQGHKVTLTSFEYNNSIPDLLSASEQIVSQGYDIVIGPRTSQEALTTAPVFEKANLPQIVPVASHEEITRKYRNTFRIIGSSESYSKKIAKFIHQVLEPKKIVVVSNLSSPYSTNYRSAILPNLERLKSKATLAYIDLIDGTTDYKTVVDKILKENPEVIYAPVYSVDLTNLYANLSERKISVKIVTHAGMFNATELLNEHYKPGIELFFNGLWDVKSVGHHDHRFKRLLKTDCKGMPENIRTAAAYDAFLLAAEMTKISAKSGANLVAAARKIKFHGILGEWKSEEFGEPYRPLPIYKFTKKGQTPFYTVQ
ncbi:MAG: ABC transporter substrate-binding protein [Bdellovibrionota bacterium]